MPQAKRLRPQRARIFIGCEGASEASYCAYLGRLLELERQDRHLDIYSCGGGDPLEIIEFSLTKSQQQAKLRGAYAMRAVLLDSDRMKMPPLRAERLNHLIRANRLIVSWQDPCFEAFALRHLNGHSADRPTTTSDAHSGLLRVWPTYVKPSTANQLESQFGRSGFDRVRSVEPDFEALLVAIGFKPI